MYWRCVIAGVTSFARRRNFDCLMCSLFATRKVFCIVHPRIEIYVFVCSRRSFALHLYPNSLLFQQDYNLGREMKEVSHGS